MNIKTTTLSIMVILGLGSAVQATTVYSHDEHGSRSVIGTVDPTVSMINHPESVPQGR
jgi:hypothetical protein